MNMFDKEIRRRAASEPSLVPAFFEARSDALLHSLAASAVPRKPFRLRPVLRIAAAAVLTILLLAGGAYAAYTMSGGEYFKAVFEAKASQTTGTDYGYMNTAQLTDMQSSTVGCVVETPELSVDVLGVIVSGNSIDVALKVTANKLDTVLYDTGIEPLNNYCFRYDTLAASLSCDSGTQQDVADGMILGEIRHIYCDTDKSLAPNQFIMKYSFMYHKPLEKKTYTVQLVQFGYRKLGQPLEGSGNDVEFIPLYDRTWSFDIAIDPKDDTSKTISIGQHIDFGGYDFTLNSAYLTPLTFALQMGTELNYDNKDGRWLSVIDAFSRGMADFSVNLKDGTRLRCHQGGTYQGPSWFGLNMTFDVPITVADVVSITVGGTEFPLG